MTTSASDMGTTRSAAAEKQRPQRRSIRIIVSALVVFGALTVTVFLARGLLDPLSNLSLKEVISSASSVGAATAPTDVTASACAGAGCIEATDTKEALYLRFSTREQAKAYTAGFGDAYQSNYIVLDFTSKADADPGKQQLAIENLAGTWQDVEDTPPRRG